MMARSSLAKGVHRECLVPGYGGLRFLGAGLARRIERAGAAAFDLTEDVALGLIHARQREGIAGRDGIVADACQCWGFRRLARELRRDNGGASLALRLC